LNRGFSYCPFDFVMYTKLEGKEDHSPKEWAMLLAPLKCLGGESMVKWLKSGV